MTVLRDIFRRRARSILTISGIGVGVFALVVLAAAAENSNVYVERLVGHYRNVITVVEEHDANWVGMANGNRPIDSSLADRLREFPGVKSVYPQVNMLLDEEYFSAIPPMALSVAPGEEYVPLKIASGRALKGDEHGLTVIGTDLATQLKAGVGDTVDVRGEEFEVVGVYERSYVNLIDAAAFIPIADAQRLYFETLPDAYQKNVRPEDLLVQMSVYSKPGVDPDDLASEIERDIDGIRATGPAEMMKMVNSIVALFNAVLGSMGFLALFVGGLSIVNTMTISVTERTREIGVKRALGASRARIAREVLAESALMAGLGGVGGVLMGTLVVTTMNAAMVRATGTSALLMTPRLALGAVAFAVLVGTIGGLYPARVASRLDPATALGYE